MKRRRRKSSKLDYTKLTPVEVYNHVLKGTLLTFPNGYVTPENMKPIIREVILNRNKLTREEICDKVNTTYLREYNLGGAIKAFRTKIYELISYCFPEFDIKPWELTKLNNGFWKEEKNRKDFMLWLAEKESIDLESIDSLKRIDARLVQKYGGSKPLQYGGGLYNLILLIAKVDVKEWQVIKMRVWTEEKAKEAVKWLIEEQLNWSYDEVVEKISARVFYKHNLGGLLLKYCNHSPLKALQIAYPGVYTKVKNVRPEYLIKK